MRYTAHYMETVIPAGFQDGKGAGHRHPGPEAWFVLSGGQCLETPNGVMTAQAGQSMLAAEGWPMTISSLGSDTRRAVVLILHRSDEPSVMAIDAKADAPHAIGSPRVCAPSEAYAGRWDLEGSTEGRCNRDRRHDDRGRIVTCSSRVIT